MRRPSVVRGYTSVSVSVSVVGTEGCCECWSVYLYLNQTSVCKADCDSDTNVKYLMTF